MRIGTVGSHLAAAAHAQVAPDLARAVLAGPRADLYIAHYPAALQAAACAARRHNARYAFDAEDYHLGDLSDEPRHDLDKRIIRVIEGRNLPGATYITAASPLIAQAYAETYGIEKPGVILNVFPKASAPAGPTPMGVVSPSPSLYWFSQTIGPGRGLECAVEAIARARSQPNLYLRGSPAVGYEDRLRALARSVGVGDRVHFLQPAPPDTLERLGCEYDLGFIGELEATRNRKIALTNKLFSYLSSGIPIVASDVAAHRAISCDLGEAIKLFPVGDAEALAASIDTYLTDPARLASARKKAWHLGQGQYCWEVEATKFLAHVRTAFNEV